MTPPINRVNSIILFASSSMRELLERAAAAAATSASVLLTGETGTGKGVLARAIHDLSPRAGRAFEKCNIASLPGTLIESELFGHCRGAFTGADSHREGRFEAANGGTLFLDEIADLPVDLQPKLLGVLDDHVVHRVGETRARKVDVRIIAATSLDLEERLAAKAFRADLFYRLNVVNLHLPPLRDRIEDIEPLAKYFVGKCSGVQDASVQCSGFSGESDLTPEHRTLNTPLPFIIHPFALDLLRSHSWPGNVRELEHMMARAVMTARRLGTNEITEECLLGNGVNIEHSTLRQAQGLTALNSQLSTADTREIMNYEG